MIRYDRVQQVVYILDGFDEDQPRDEQGRWTGGGDPTRAGTHEVSGKPLKPRAFEYTTPEGQKYTFSDHPGEKDTYTFAFADKALRQAEAHERMLAAVAEHAKPGREYQGTKRKGREIFHIYSPEKEEDIEDIEPAGTYRRVK